MICRGLDGWIEIDTGPSELFDDGYSSLDRPDPAVCQEEQEAMQEAVADMVREITWLEHLSFAGFDGVGLTYQKMKELQTLVRTRH